MQDGCMQIGHRDLVFNRSQTYFVGRSMNMACLDPATGKVAVMLHTFVGEQLSEVERVVEEPFINYLRSATSLSKFLYEKEGLDPDQIPEADKEIMLHRSYMRYSKTSALIGTVRTCRPMIKRMAAIGVNEIACLVDFGIPESTVVENLKHLGNLAESVSLQEAAILN